jgi:hypothetical protein
VNAFELPTEYADYGELSTLAARERRRDERWPTLTAIFDHSIAPAFADDADEAIAAAEQTLDVMVLGATA